MTDLPLYPSEAQIAHKVLGPNRLDEWKALAMVLERKGLPPIDPQFGGRPWLKVERWFQAYNGLCTIAPGQLGKQDGGETCPPRKRKESPAKTCELWQVGCSNRVS